MKSLIQIIKEAATNKIAIGHFNIGNLEQLKAIAHAAIKLNVPVIVGVSEGEREFLGTHHVRDLIKSYNDEHALGDGFRLFLNADHTHSLEKAKDAAENGFDAVLFDGGKLEFEKNIRETKEVVEIIKNINSDILVEGELGYIGSASEVFTELPKGAAITPESFTKAEDALRFVNETGVDMFAPAVGNIHGMFKNAPEPRLDIGRIREIKEILKNLPAGRQVPLVLHGGSGVSDEDFLAAIDAGISIIHISTELRVAWRKSLEESLKEKPEEVAPYKIETEVVEAMEKIVEGKLRLFNKVL